MAGTPSARRQAGTPDAERGNPDQQIRGESGLSAAAARTSRNKPTGEAYAPRGSSAGTASATAVALNQRERIERRAYEIYEQRGGEPGHEVEDWLRAEQEVLGQSR